MSSALVLAAAAAAGEAGISAADAADAIPPGKLQRADAGRALKALVDAGHLIAIEGQRGRWAITPDGALAVLPSDELEQLQDAPPRVPGAIPGPLVEKLPPAPADASPYVGSPVASSPPIEVVRSIAQRAAANPHLTEEERSQLRAFSAVHGIDDYTLWLPGMFPKRFTAPFAPHHHEFWRWVSSIERGRPRDPFVGVWNRGGAKSANVEAALVYLAARAARGYAIYVSGTQTLADEHVGSISALLESPQLAAAYPALSQRDVGKYGESKGWRRNRLRTAAGFTVDALGLDVAARGARIEDQRPDIIVLDDIDSDNDTPALTEKKVRAITRKLLPAGSQDVVVIGIQNMIHSSSIFARLARMPNAPAADYLAMRHVSGPIPAVYDLQYALKEARNEQGQLVAHYEITGGRPSWEGMPLEACQHMLNLYGLTGFLVEAQHQEADLAGGTWDHIVDILHKEKSPWVVDEEAVPHLVHVCVWVDPAVSSTDRSDSCGIVVDGLGADGLYYRLWSWERIASPTEALKTAIRVGIEHGAHVIGVETDQGGDTWEVVYLKARAELMEEDPELFETAARIPRYEYAKAGSTRQSKVERNARMLADYEMGRFRHVRHRCQTLEGGLRRFPRYKPFDVVDAAYWSWRWLAELGGENRAAGRGVRVRRARGALAEISPANI